MIKIGDVVFAKRPPCAKAGRYMTAKDVFNIHRFYIVLDVWQKTGEICLVMNCDGEISWISTKYLKIISRV